VNVGVMGGEQLQHASAASFKRDNTLEV